MKILVGAGLVLTTLVLFSKPAKAKSNGVIVDIGPSIPEETEPEDAGPQEGIPRETPIDRRPPPKGPFSDLPIGTLVNREGFPEAGFLDPAWKIVSKQPPHRIGNTIFFTTTWSYSVVAVPAPQIGTNQPARIDENDISSLI